MGESPPKYDRYGFPVDSRNASEEVNPVASKKEMTKGKKWGKFLPMLSSSSDAMFTTRSGKQRPKNPLLRRKLRRMVLKGIPEDLRAEVWSSFLGSKETSSQYPCLYRDLLAWAEGRESDAISEIAKDVARTFPDHFLFGEPEAREALRRVLTGVAWHNSKHGYTQSMNYLAAVLLLFYNEEQAFWTLDALVLTLPGYHTGSLAG